MSWEQLDKIVDIRSGAIGSVAELPSPPGASPVHWFCAKMGDLGEILPHVAPMEAEGNTGDNRDGVGGSPDQDLAKVIGAIKALERYCSCVFTSEQLSWATADELDGRVLDLDSVPVCSETERNGPGGVLQPPMPDEPIRWVQGVSLNTGERVWLPAIMVYLHISYGTPAERFWLPISTGCAAHFDRHAALLNGLLEVVERDATALVWHQMLDLPVIVPDECDERGAAIIDQLERSSSCITFFDATFEHGIPTIYAWEQSPHDELVHSFVMCATDVDPLDAMAKIVRECASSRFALVSKSAKPLAKQPEQFSDVYDGARYLTPIEMAHAFDFLQSTDRQICSSQRPAIPADTSAQGLKNCLDRLGNRGHEAFAVDLTTTEARRCGVSAYRVLVPSLQPLSFAFGSQYRAHPRLYSVPGLLGQPARPEDQLNPYPQAIA